MVQDPVIPIIADLIKQTPDVISLGQGVVNYGPPAAVIEHIKHIKMTDDFHLYSAVEGTADLRDVILKKLQHENGITVSDRQQVVITAGANMAFVNALFAITDPDDEIIVLKPYYFNHDMAISMLNCHTIAVDTDSEFQPCLDKIKDAITGKTKAIVTVSPNNPSGAVYPEPALTAINQLCLEHGLYHISDEAYEYFTYDGDDHFSVASLPDSETHTITLFSLSKAYGFASWRIGYMLIPDQLFSAIRKAQDTYLICPTRIAQEAAVAAIKEGKSYCLSHLANISAVRGMFYAALQSINDICTTPKCAGAFYFLVKLETDQTGMQIVQELIKNYKIAVIPGETFGLPDACYIRIAYAALDNKSSKIGIQRLIDGLNGIIRK